MIRVDKKLVKDGKEYILSGVSKLDKALWIKVVKNGNFTIKIIQYDTVLRTINEQTYSRCRNRIEEELKLYEDTSQYVVSLWAYNVEVFRELVVL